MTGSVFSRATFDGVDLAVGQPEWPPYRRACMRRVSTFAAHEDARPTSFCQVAGEVDAGGGLDVDAA